MNTTNTCTMDTRICDPLHCNYATGITPKCYRSLGHIVCQHYATKHHNSLTYDRCHKTVQLSTNTSVIRCTMPQITPNDTTVYATSYVNITPRNNTDNTARRPPNVWSNKTVQQFTNASVIHFTMPRTTPNDTISLCHGPRQMIPLHYATDHAKWYHTLRHIACLNYGTKKHITARQQRKNNNNNILYSFQAGN